MGLQIGDTYCPICGSKADEWTDDPILTPRGLSGDTYVGCTRIKPIHITELQEARQQQEIDAGIEEADRTVFSKVEEPSDPLAFWVPNKKHIKELRDSTEQILKAMNLTLQDMLNYNADGNRMYLYEFRQGQRIRRGMKTGWTDPDIDTDTFKVKAIHIEELRCTIPIDIPMHLINRGLGYTSVQDGDSVQGICYNEVANRWIGYVNMFIVSTWHTNDKDAGRTPVEAIEEFFIPNHPNDPPLETIYGTSYYSTDDGTPILSVLVVAARSIWNCYRFKTVNSGWQQKITCIPQDDNLDLIQYSLQELISIPELVLETPGYPCQMYAGDTWYYAVPYIKSSGFLEDAIEGASYAMPKESYPATVIFKSEHLTPTVGASGVNEPAFDTRRMETNSWGMSYPPANLIDGEGYFRSVGLRGTNPCGNFSIYMPSSWLDSGIIRHRKNTRWGYTFQSDGCIYYGPMTSWLIDLTDNEIETDVLDPSTGNYVPRRFDGNALFAKRDDDNGVIGVVVAKDYQEFSQTIDENTTEISLPSDTVARTVKMSIGDEQWQQVNDLDGWAEMDKIFIVEDNKIKFGNGISGYRVTGSTSVSISCYIDEIVPTKIYASGYIALPYDASLMDTSCYVYVEYYETPSSYNELASPETLYEVSYWDKPSMSGADIGSGNVSFMGWNTLPCPQVTQGNILPQQTAIQAMRRLVPA